MTEEGFVQMLCKLIKYKPNAASRDSRVRMLHNNKLSFNDVLKLLIYYRIPEVLIGNLGYSDGLELFYKKVAVRE
jgi:hypothetical protein